MAMTTRRHENALYYYGARYYDPKVSVWLSVDPKADWYPSQSPYNFSLNNPINLVDPNGQWVEGAGFFRNVFNSDEKILAQDLAAEHDGEAFKHGDAWRATWTTPNNANVEGVDLNLDDLHIVDFKKGVKRDGTYDSGQHMADAKLDSWLGHNMRSGLTKMSKDAEEFDGIAPKIAMTATIFTSGTVVNSGMTMLMGQDIYENKKEGLIDRVLLPLIDLTAFFASGGATGLLKDAKDVDTALDLMETNEIWKSNQKKDKD